MTATSHHPPLTLLVHRPGRMMSLAAAAILIVGVGLLLAYQWGERAGRGWLNLLLMIPAVVGFVAIMRTGTTRCEVWRDGHRLTVRSVDASTLLGREREVSYAWSDVARVAWVGEDNDELRLDFATAPKALVFSGARRDLEALHTAATAKPPGR